MVTDRRWRVLPDANLLDYAIVDADGVEIGCVTDMPPSARRAEAAAIVAAHNAAVEQAQTEAAPSDAQPYVTGTAEAYGLMHAALRRGSTLVAKGRRISLDDDAAPAAQPKGADMSIELHQEVAIVTPAGDRLYGKVSSVSDGGRTIVAVVMNETIAAPDAAEPSGLTGAWDGFVEWDEAVGRMPRERLTAYYLQALVALRARRDEIRELRSALVVRSADTARLDWLEGMVTNHKEVTLHTGDLARGLGLTLKDRTLRVAIDESRIWKRDE